MNIKITTLIWAVLLALTLGQAVSRADDHKKKAQAAPVADDTGAPTFPSLQAEIDAHHMADDLLQARLRIVDLQSRMSDARNQIKGQAKADHEGIKLLKTYVKLLTVRYVGDEGEFARAMEVSAEDVTNLNQLFDRYLRRMPFAAQWGRVSAGFVRETVDRGIDQLQDQLSAHESPDPGNNGEMEIFATQIKLEKEGIDKLLDLADSKGIKLDPKAPLPDGARVPAAAD